MLIIVLLFGITAFADMTTYYNGNDANKETLTSVPRYYTVLVTNSNDEIAYVDQADSSFIRASKFILKVI